jgi:hypothetical protein
MVHHIVQQPAATLLPPSPPLLCIPKPTRFFCESGLNVLGVSVDPCIESGAVCGPSVADTLCQVRAAS